MASAAAAKKWPRESTEGESGGGGEWEIVRLPVSPSPALLIDRNAKEGVPYCAARVPYSAANEPQVRLVHQRGRLQRLSRLLLGQASGGELPEFVIDQRQQLLGGSRIAGLGRLQDLRDIAHGSSA